MFLFLDDAKAVAKKSINPFFASFLSFSPILPVDLIRLSIN